MTTITMHDNEFLDSVSYVASNANIKLLDYVMEHGIIYEFILSRCLIQTFLKFSCFSAPCTYGHALVHTVFIVSEILTMVNWWWQKGQNMIWIF